MKSLKDILKKPAFIKSVLGALAIGLGVLTYQNIGLKNQNTYFYNKYKEVGEKYVNVATKYSQLEMKKYMDSMQISLGYCIDILKMQKEQFKLIYSKDSLEDEYINLAKRTLEGAEQRRDILEKLILVTQEKEFYKKYSHYLDSLNLKYEFDNFKIDSTILK